SWRGPSEAAVDAAAEPDRPAVRRLLADADPRVRGDVAAFLRAAGEATAPPVLRAALAREGEGSLGGPWGQRPAGAARNALRAAAVRTDGATWTGGVEVRSCQHGDLFVRWNADGEVGFGLDLERRVRLESALFAPFARALAELPPAEPAVHGTVVCDFVRVAV